MAKLPQYLNIEDDDATFIRVWNSASSPTDVARRFGVENQIALSKASQLRKKGYDVKYFKIQNEFTPDEFVAAYIESKNIPDLAKKLNITPEKVNGYLGTVRCFARDPEGVDKTRPYRRISDIEGFLARDSMGSKIEGAGMGPYPEIPQDEFLDLWNDHTKTNTDVENEIERKFGLSPAQSSHLARWMSGEGDDVYQRSIRTETNITEIPVGGPVPKVNRQKFIDACRDPSLSIRDIKIRFRISTYDVSSLSMFLRKAGIDIPRRSAHGLVQHPKPRSKIDDSAYTVNNWNRLNPDEFTRVWESSSSLSDIMHHFKITGQKASAFAKNLRKKGYALKKFSSGKNPATESLHKLKQMIREHIRTEIQNVLSESYDDIRKDLLPIAVAVLRREITRSFVDCTGISIASITLRDSRIQDSNAPFSFYCGIHARSPVISVSAEDLQRILDYDITSRTNIDSHVLKDLLIDSQKMTVMFRLDLYACDVRAIAEIGKKTKFGWWELEED